MQAESSASPLARIQPWHALVAIVLVGALLRFYRLEHQSFWYDETVSARFVSYPLLDVLAGRERDLGNPPLHYALLGLWSRLFGSSDAALRSLSAVVSLAGIPVLYSIARRLAGPRVGLIAAALLALSPVQVYFAQENRAYALLGTIAMLSVDSLLRAEDSPDRPWPWLLYSATVFLCPYTHYFGFFFLAGHVVYVLLRHRKDRKMLLRWAAAVGAAALLFSLVWLPSLYAQMSTEGNLARSAGAWRLHLAATPMYFTVGTTLVWKDSATWPRLAGAALALASFGAAFVAGLVALRANRRALAMLLLWLLSPIVIPLTISVFLFPLYNARYALVAAPALLVVAAAGLVHLSRLPRAAAAAGIVATSAASLVFYFSSAVKHDWRTAAAWLDTQARPGDVIAFDVDTGQAPFARYSRAQALHLRLVRPEAGARAGEFAGTPDRLVPPHDVGDTLRSATRIWFVLSDPGDGSDGYYEELFGRTFAAHERRQFRGIDVALFTPRR